MYELLHQITGFFPAVHVYYSPGFINLTINPSRLEDLMEKYRKNDRYLSEIRLLYGEMKFDTKDAIKASNELGQIISKIIKQVKQENPTFKCFISNIEYTVNGDQLILPDILINLPKRNEEKYIPQDIEFMKFFHGELIEWHVQAELNTRYIPQK